MLKPLTLRPEQRVPVTDYHLRLLTEITWMHRQLQKLFRGNDKLKNQERIDHAKACIQRDWDRLVLDLGEGLTQDLWVATLKAPR